MELLDLEDAKYIFNNAECLYYVDDRYKIIQFRTTDIKIKDRFINTFNNVNNTVIGEFKYFICLIPCLFPTLDLNVLGYRTQPNNIVYPWPFEYLNKSTIEQWFVNFIVTRVKIV